MQHELLEGKMKLLYGIETTFEEFSLRDSCNI